MVARETSALREDIRAALAEAGIPASHLAVERLGSYASVLLERALPLGFIGPQEADRLIPRHIVESAALSAFLAPGERVVDVGSGAGLPGLVLACLGWRVEIVETLVRRAAFLADCAANIALDVHVLNIRAEDAGRREDLRDAFDVCVARALAAPAVAMELCLPLVRAGGRLLVAATPSDGDELLAEVTAQLGAGPPRWEELSVPGADHTRCVMIVEKLSPTPDRFPRRAGVPKRRPLG